MSKNAKQHEAEAEQQKVLGSGCGLLGESYIDAKRENDYSI